jgi:hypothetical protein
MVQIQEAGIRLSVGRDERAPLRDANGPDAALASAVIAGWACALRDLAWREGDKLT